MVTIFILYVIQLFLPLTVQAQEIQKANSEEVILGDGSQLSSTEIISETQRNIEEAKALFSMGVEKASQNHWAEAEELFRRSNQIKKRPNCLFNLALSLMHQDRVSESRKIATNLLENIDSTQNAVLYQRIEELLERLQAMNGKLSLFLNPITAKVAIDGIPAEKTGSQLVFILEPGKHYVVASAKGFISSHLEIEIRSNETHELTVFLSAKDLPDNTISPMAATPPFIPPQTIPTHWQGKIPDRSHPSNSLGQWFLGASGGVLLLGAGITTVAAMMKKSEIDDICPNRKKCNEANKEELTGLWNQQEDYFFMSNVLLGIGTASILVSLTWWLFFDGEEPQSQISTIDITRREFTMTLRGSL